MIKLFRKNAFPFYKYSDIELPIVKVRVYNKEYNFIVDSGSTISVVSKDSEALKHVKKSNVIYKLRGIENTANSQSSGLLPIDIGSVTKLTEVLMVSNPGFSNIEKRKGIKIDGLLGSNFLFDNKAVISYKDGYLKLL